MNADLTYNTISFKKSYDDSEKSVRRSIARGVSTPDELILKYSSFTDPNTKVLGQRGVVRIDRTSIDAAGVKNTMSAYLTLMVPGNVAQADVSSVIATLQAVVADTAMLNSVLNQER